MTQIGRMDNDMLVDTSATVQLSLSYMAIAVKPWININPNQTLTLAKAY